jgi:hypothetical protein
MLIHSCAVAMSPVVTTTRFTGSGARADDRNCGTDRFTDREGSEADARTRTADPFITRTPRRLWLVAVRGADHLGQANFGRFAP